MTDRTRYWFTNWPSKLAIINNSRTHDVTLKQGNIKQHQQAAGSCTSTYIHFSAAMTSDV